MTSIHHVCLALPLRICLERGEKLQAARQAKLVPTRIRMNFMPEKYH